MPRYAITSNFTTEETETIEKACKIKGCSKYKLLREATMSLSEAIIDEEKEKLERERKDDSGIEERGSGTVKVGY